MADNPNNLPSTIQGDGRKFISLLKNYLKDVTTVVDDIYTILGKEDGSPTEIDGQIKNVRVTEKTVGDAVVLDISWNKDDITHYSGVNISVKENNGYHTKLWKDIEVTRRYRTGNVTRFTLENIVVGHSYLITVQGRDKNGSISKEEKAPVIEHYVSPDSHTPLPPYDFTVIFDKRGTYWHWKQRDNNGSQWSELRLDEHVGEEHNRLDVTTDLYSNAVPPVRTGKAYLYNKGIGNSYTKPVILDFAKPVPQAPRNIVVKPVFEGLTITFDEIPENCSGANIYVNGEKFSLKTNSFVYNCSTGEYTIKICYTDSFGEGEFSSPVVQNTLEEIPPDAVHITDKTVFDNGVIVAKYIGDKAVVGTKIADGVITTDKLSANAVTASKIATNAITTDKIQAGAITTETMNVNSINGDRIIAGTLSADKIKSGSITSNQIATGTITTDNIQSGAVTADKIAAGVISLAKTDTIINGGAVTLDGTGMNVLADNGTRTLFDGNGITWIDKHGIPHSAIRQMIYGEAKHGDTITYNWDSAPMVLVNPPIDNVFNLGDDCIQVNRAVNVTKNSFMIESYVKKSGGRTNAIILHPYRIPPTRDTRSWTSDCHHGECSHHSEDYLDSGVINEEEMGKKIALYAPVKAIYLIKIDGISSYFDDFIISIDKRVISTKDDFGREIPCTLEEGYHVMTFEVRKLKELNRFIDKNKNIDITVKIKTELLNVLIIPNENPVQFIALERTKDSYFTTKRKATKSHMYTGRGTYKFKPTGKHLRVVLVGASDVQRRASSETSIVGNGINARTSRNETKIRGIDNTSPNTSNYSDAWHWSYKGGEIQERDFAEIMWNTISKSDRGEWTYDNVVKTKYKTYGYVLSAIPIAIEQEYIPTHGGNGRVLSYRASEYPNTRFIVENGGVKTKQSIIGASFMTPEKRYWYGNDGGYQREYVQYYTINMGLSKPVIVDIDVPENATEYTITVGACPDVEKGKVMDFPYGKLTCHDTTMYDGGVFIIEEGENVL
ncbi:hypothetical protein HMPREF0872_03800 [Veillonella montpellierensis DNF00314]|uniref:Fibronectin type-III domain-containing protein n=1 Tax=Veillonella montpellierensis DNF00314 TaxID=1401067 RepID=A0A096ALK6_9FIRM|nr:calcium-binding protein [Veillonella montpellierensis]KGF47536.1 hypothetical protein HMPREF0872_03800 [Veillonella montpellierensis DNF00314]